MKAIPVNIVRMAPFFEGMIARGMLTAIARDNSDQHIEAWYLPPEYLDGKRVFMFERRLLPLMIGYSIDPNTLGNVLNKSINYNHIKGSQQFGVFAKEVNVCINQWRFAAVGVVPVPWSDKFH